MKILEAKNITKMFPGVIALDSVDVAFEPGEIHAIIGENGAGKSTLIKCLTGVYEPEEGEVMIGGENAMKNKALFDKVAYVPQEIDLFGYMSVDKRYDSRQKIYMCITALFIKQNNEVADNARAMLKHFTCLLCDTKGICVNIHPSMISAIHFWMENGFVQAPEMSNYVNAEDQRLIAYWKTLRYNETREN